MLRPSGIERIYLHRVPVDMRKQIDGLAALAQQLTGETPAGAALFAFTNARRDKVKLLLWEKNGFVVWYKRLEREKFHWPRHAGETAVRMSCEQLNWLLDGYDVWRMRPHAALHFAVLS